MELRKLLRVLLAVVAVMVLTPATAADDKGQLSGFTCCNLHYSGDWISDANYGSQPMLPAGLPIKVIDYGRYRVHVEIDGKPMRLGQDYGRTEPLPQFAGKFVVDKDPKAKIATWPANVREAVRFGKVTAGMTKEQVLVSLGYPALHQTPTIEAPQWKYWYTQYGSFLVLFDEKDRVKDVIADAGTRATVLMDVRK
ncbi:MAG TPA: outer membrane protein assembly factor BamE [Burkholderiaceae bacterium]|nr:outer membrane protein assembly factor BamE [Burkholderiaceae bacterium]